MTSSASRMWTPGSWSDIEALIGVRDESESVDLKRELPTQGHDFSKDIAAMSKRGGVILYGVAEDKARRVASKITPVPVDGAEERIRSATQDVEPRVEFQIAVLRPAPDAVEGVVVVIVPPSSHWPHMVGGRYPVRDGTITRYLSHAETEAALGLQRGTSAPPARPADLFDPVVDRLPGIAPVRARSVFFGFCHIRVAVRPERPGFVHPKGAWLQEPLEEALERTATSAEESIDSRWAAEFLKRLERWKAEGAETWLAGYAGGDEGTLAQRPRASAVLVNGTGHLLMEVTRPTVVSDDEGRFGYLCAFEPFVAAEIWTMLNFAGELFTEDGRIGPLDVGLQLAGFAECVSHHATHADPVLAGKTSHLPTAPPSLTRAVTAAAPELRDNTDRVARQLLDPWLPPFYEDAIPLYDKVMRRGMALRS